MQLNYFTRYYLKSFIIISLLLSYSCSEDEKGAEEQYVIKDADGNIYSSVKIGTQTWLQENLKTTKYNNGDPIATTSPLFKDISDEISPLYQWAYEGDESLVDSYGRLYTWYVVADNRGICPVGWHVPTLDEHEELIGFFSNLDEAFKSLKEAGTEHWLYPNAGTNSSGFNAVPAGRRFSEGTFCGLYCAAFFWNSTNDSFHPGTWSHAFSISTCCSLSNFSNSEAFSVRCVKD